jgi:hypothetical protein
MPVFSRIRREKCHGILLLSIRCEKPPFNMSLEGGLTKMGTWGRGVREGEEGGRNYPNNVCT